MTVAVGGERKMAESLRKEKYVLPYEYGCEVLLEKTTMDKVRDPSFPNDAYLIWYLVDGERHMDLTRCPKMVNLFDMYYDKYGPGAVQKIDFGYGRLNPKLWGNVKKEKKKKR